MATDDPSIRYLVRLMSFLLIRDETTITNLAMMSRINHQRCLELIRWLQASGYAHISERRKKRYIALTEDGYRYGKRLIDVYEMSRSIDNLKSGLFVADGKNMH